jgi:low temperature requirement protein LtrA
VRRIVTRIARTLAGASSGTFRWEPPRLRVEEDGDAERHSTWFELYFDLVFVAAVAQLATGLASNPSAAVFGRFVGLFAIIFWAWTGFTFFANRFDTDDLLFRLDKSGAMLAIAAVAIGVHRLMAGHGGTVGFAAAYVVVRVLLVGLYLRTRLYVHGPAERLVNT